MTEYRDLRQTNALTAVGAYQSRISNFCQSSAKDNHSYSAKLVLGRTVDAKVAVLDRHNEKLTFLIMGQGVAKGRSLGEIDMRAIAPTLAAILGVPLPGADLQAIPLLGQNAAQARRDRVQALSRV